MDKARILTFHIDPHEHDELTAELAVAAERLARCPGFGGLICLEHNGTRQQITVITLWDEAGMAATAGEHELARQRIAATTDLGVTSRTDSVVSFVPGQLRGQAIAELLAS